MSKNNTKPNARSLLGELNNLVGEIFLKDKKRNPHTDRKAAEEKLSDGRNPLTLKNDPRNN